MTEKRWSEAFTRTAYHAYDRAYRRIAWFFAVSTGTAYAVGLHEPVL